MGTIPASFTMPFLCYPTLCYLPPPPIKRGVFIIYINIKDRGLIDGDDGDVRV